MLAVAGRPLAAYPAAALVGRLRARRGGLQAGDGAAASCPASSAGTSPTEPRHPLTGIVHALERAGGPVLVCAADMPFVTPDACRTLLQAAGSGAGSPAVVAAAAGVLQPVLGLYAPAALEPLRAAPDDAPLTATVEGLDPLRMALPPALVRSVNTPEDLAEAGRRSVRTGAGATRLR